eukprot:3818717-Rhodomonas_salina.2
MREEKPRRSVILPVPRADPHAFVEATRSRSEKEKESVGVLPRHVVVADPVVRRVVCDVELALLSRECSQPHWIPRSL